MANNKLLEETLQHIKEHPESWNQATWRCETGMCFAGTAVSLAGGQWLTEPSDLYSDAVLPVDDDKLISAVSKAVASELPPGTLYTAADVRAAAVLDINDSQASALFDYDNTLGVLTALVDAIKAGVSDYTELCAVAEDSAL